MHQQTFNTSSRKPTRARGPNKPSILDLVNPLEEEARKQTFNTRYAKPTRAKGANKPSILDLVLTHIENIKNYYL